METHVIAALLLAAAAVAALAVLVSRRLAARRREALASAALALGLEFTPAPGPLEALPAGARALSRGRRHTFRNALRGRRGDTSVLVVDHGYVTGSGKNSSHHRRTLVVLRRAGLALPAFFMRPQVPVFDAVGKLVGLRDLDFPEDDEFSRAFVLQGADEAAVRRAFGIEVRQRALGLGREFEVEAAGESLLLQRSRPVAPADAVQLVERAAALLDALDSATRARW